MGDRLRAGKPPPYALPRPTQPPTLNGTGNEYQPKCGDTLRLGSNGRYTLYPYSRAVFTGRERGP